MQLFAVYWKMNILCRFIIDVYLTIFKQRGEHPSFTIVYIHTPVSDSLIIYNSRNDINSRLDLCVGGIGCGDGAVAVEFYENHPEINYTGLDINHTQLEKA